jgi:hypothetical protein
MIKAKEQGNRVSKYALFEVKFFIVSFTIYGLRNVFILSYPIVSPSFGQASVAIFFIIGSWFIQFYLCRIATLLRSIKIAIPKYIQYLDWIWQNPKRSLIFYLLCNIDLFSGFISPFIYTQETQLLYVVAIHWSVGVLTLGIPFIYSCFVSYKYMQLWQKHILDTRSFMFKTTPKTADSILLNLSVLQRNILWLIIASSTFAIWSLFIGCFLPYVSRNAVMSYMLIIGADIIIPSLMILASLPTAFQIYSSHNKRKWNDAIEDIQFNMAKSVGTYINSDDSGIDGVKPFELSPVRTESQVDRMER